MPHSKRKLAKPSRSSCNPIAEALMGASEGGVIPRGKITRIADNMHVSRQRACQLAEAEGLVIGDSIERKAVIDLLKRTTVTPEEIRRIARLTGFTESGVESIAYELVVSGETKRVFHVNPETKKPNYSKLDSQSSRAKRMLLSTYKINWGSFPHGTGLRVAAKLGLHPNYISRLKRQMTDDGIFPKKKKK